MTPGEHNAYARGVAAGTRRRDQDFERAVFLAVLPELIRAPWQTNGEAWTSMDQFVEGAAKIAEKAVKRV